MVFFFINMGTNNYNTRLKIKCPEEEKEMIDQGFVILDFKDARLFIEAYHI